MLPTDILVSQAENNIKKTGTERGGAALIWPLNLHSTRQNQTVRVTEYDRELDDITTGCGNWATEMYDCYISGESHELSDDLTLTTEAPHTRKVGGSPALIVPPSDKFKVEDAVSSRHQSSVVSSEGFVHRLNVEGEAPAAAATRPAKRRNCRLGSLELDLNMDDYRSSGVTLPPRDIEGAKSALFACPFYKRDSRKHHECLKYGLRRVKDVKQHIYRRHARSGLYCPRCYKAFSVAESRGRHMREGKCGLKAEPEFDSISEQQRKTLMKNQCRGRSAEDQWFDMWCVIFPDQHKPQSCYLGKYLEVGVIMPRLRGFWDDRRSKDIRGVLDTRPIRDLGHDLFDSIVRNFFDRFEAETAGSVNDSNQTISPTTSPGLPQPIAATISSVSSNVETVSGEMDNPFFMMDQASCSLAPSSGPLISGEIYFEPFIFSDLNFTGLSQEEGNAYPFGALEVQSNEDS